jgi:hypothetical protein
MHLPEFKAHVQLVTCLLKERGRKIDLEAVRRINSEARRIRSGQDPWDDSTASPKNKIE